MTPERVWPVAGKVVVFRRLDPLVRIEFQGVGGEVLDMETGMLAFRADGDSRDHGDLVPSVTMPMHGSLAMRGGFLYLILKSAIWPRVAVTGDVASSR